MKALNLIIQREYLSRIKKKSFLILTIVMPFLSMAVLFVPLLLSNIKDSEAKRIVVIDDTGIYTSQLKSSEYYVFENSNQPISNIRSSVGEEVFGLVHITADLASNPKGIIFYSEKQAPRELLGYINMTFSEFIKNNKLAHLTEQSNIDKAIVQDIQSIVKAPNISISTMQWDNDGQEKQSSTELASFIGMVFSLLIYLFVFTYGAMVMHGVIEEKSNRIVEIMISSVRPFDLMLGKIIGIGLTGITQILVWMFMAIGLFYLKNLAFDTSDSESISNILALIATVNWIQLFTYFFLFFIGGFMIYASLFAMFGSAVDNPQDAQQFVMPVTFIFLFALYAGMYSAQNPDGPLAFWCSMIPLTSPIVMMVRIPFGVPMHEILISLVILYVSIFLMVKTAAKVYRVGILMYGKKPSLKELYKWMWYK